MSQKNTIVDCIYKPPNVPLGEFTNDFLESLLEKLFFEKQEVILMGNFIINLLICNIDNNTCDYVDILYSQTIYPSIKSSMQITPNSKTLIDKIFYKNVTNNIISGNLIASISDHLTQFLLIFNQNQFSKHQMFNTNV